MGKSCIEKETKSKIKTKKKKLQYIIRCLLKVHAVGVTNGQNFSKLSNACHGYSIELEVYSRCSTCEPIWPSGKALGW